MATYFRDFLTRGPEAMIAAYRARSGKPVRVLHVNAYWSKGGAARAACMVHCTLLSRGIESVMVTKEAPVPSDNILPTCRKGPGAYLREYFAWMRYLLLAKSKVKADSTRSPQIVSSYSLERTIGLLRPEIVHLHWICEGYITIEEIGRIGVPVVWTMHDMWPVLSEKHICYSDSHRTGYNDTNADRREQRTWARKQENFKRLDSLTCVGVSRYMRDLAEESLLFEGREATNFPNPILRASFHRRHPGEGDAPVIPSEHEGRLALLFVSGYVDHNKGIDLLDAALREPCLADRLDRLFLLTVGPISRIPLQSSIRRHDLGVVKSDERMAQIYSGVHLTLVPSRFESYSLCAAESICCGTPVVSFDTSGLRDVIEEGVTGFRARCFEPADFAAKIALLLDRIEGEGIDRGDTWEKACERFSPESVAAGYEQLYDSILSK
jgi:glycosyltransferase involved in cell wall biosynthesis